jgi:ABC-2 type transport system ATP-binding protein
MNVLDISHVSKRFGNKQVLDDISFQAAENEIIGLIGVNGAGKTTTIKAILGLLKTDAGTITLCGERVQFRELPSAHRIGYLQDVPEFYSYMTAKEYLGLCGKIAGIRADERQKQCAEILELIGLAGEKARIGGYSRGMKQRLGIAQALIGSPKLLICDEPTSALDPLGRHAVLELLSQIKSKTSVLLSTHILSDAEHVCDRIALLHHGKIVLSGNLDAIRQLHSELGIRLILQNQQDTKAVCSRYPDAQTDGNTVLILSAEPDFMQQIMQFLTGAQISPVRLEQMQPNLEDLFMEEVAE